MSGKARGGHIWLTLREMRIAKMNKKVSIKPCASEFEDFLRAQAAIGPEYDVPHLIAQALQDCMDDVANTKAPIKMSSHLKRYLKPGER